MDQLWRELKRLIAANRQAASVDALASDAADWVLGLTPQQARRQAGMTSKHFWLRNLVEDFWLLPRYPLWRAQVPLCMAGCGRLCGHQRCFSGSRPPVGRVLRGYLGSYKMPSLGAMLPVARYLRR